MVEMASRSPWSKLALRCALFDYYIVQKNLYMICQCFKIRKFHAKILIPGFSFKNK